MHLSWINVMADAAELLVAGLVVLYCCLGAPPSAQRGCAGRTWRVVIRTLTGNLT
jgi:hypothetical protein